ncbi:MAG: GTPase Era [Pseudomonadota bacterium]
MIAKPPQAGDGGNGDGPSEAAEDAASVQAPHNTQATAIDAEHADTADNTTDTGGDDHLAPAPPRAQPAGPTACGFIAIIGAPNAGKSTLVNALVGAKVTIVTHKVQTTRTPVRGIALHDNAQLVFLDTPGIFKPRRRLDRAMVDAAWSGAKDADVVVLMVDAAKAGEGGRGSLDKGTAQIASALATLARPRIAVLNKIDRIKKETLLALIAQLNELCAFDDIFMLSALNGDGVADFKAHLASLMPEGPWHYPADDLSDLPLRLLAAELTREKIYLRLHQELPYAITVETTGWEAVRKGVRVEQTIYVERESQKQIVLGKGGETIKRLSIEAREDLSAIIEQPVHLFLFVKVRENWGDDPERYRELGLDFPKA